MRGGISRDRSCMQSTTTLRMWDGCHGRAQTTSSATHGVHAWWFACAILSSGVANGHHQSLGEHCRTVNPLPAKQGTFRCGQGGAQSNPTSSQATQTAY